jgi:hypothetical protein
MNRGRGIFKVLGDGVIALSALLCVALLAMMARSCFVGDEYAWYYMGASRTTCGWCITSGHGLVILKRIDDGHPRPPTSPIARTRRQFQLAEMDHAMTVGLPVRVAGFGYKNWIYPDPPNPTFSIWNAAVPFWFIALLLSILPTRRYMRWRRSRISQGDCAVCGYDLRATPERCPECGTVAGAKA